MKRKRNLSNHLLNLLAIVLGVYLAFFINEKAIASKNKKESKTLMVSILNDLSTDIEVYDEYQIPINLNYQKNINELLKVVLEEDYEEINTQLPNLFQIENYSPTSSTYNSMKFSGNVRLINDLYLMKKLNEYYDGVALECIKKNEIQVEYFMEELIAWLSENADFSEMKIRDEIDLIIFKNKLMIYKSIVDQKVKNYQLVLSESKDLNHSIDSILSIKD